MNNYSLDQKNPVGSEKGASAPANLQRKSHSAIPKDSILDRLVNFAYNGKLNFHQLGRHGKSCESRFRQNFKREFDWCGFNIGMCRLKGGKRGAVALDHSFLSKSGKKTPGLGWYWSGCAGAVKRGLEILGFAYVVPGEADARFLFAEQTIPATKRGRTPFYLEHMKDKRDNQRARCLRAVHDKQEQLRSLSDIIVGDCLFATYNIVTGLRAIGFDVVSGFRDDPVLQYLYTEPQKQGRGRKKELDGQVDEARCDFSPNRMRITNRGGVFFITLWKKSVYGRTLTDIKGDDEMVGYFADNIAPLIRSVLGSFLSGDDYAVVTTPKRRHGNCASRTQSRACSGYAEAQPIEGVANERNFASMISEKIAEHLGLPFYDDCALAPSKHRVGTVFTANNIPPQRNIIVFDDFVTTGQTLVSMQNLLCSLNRNCIFFAGINNKL